MPDREYGADASHSRIDKLFHMRRTPFFSAALQSDDDGFGVIAIAFHGASRDAAGEAEDGSEIPNVFHPAIVTEFWTKENPKTAPKCGKNDDQRLKFTHTKTRRTNNHNTTYVSKTR
jgi:hypothetical protein